MKLTDPDIIKDGERDLINAIEDDLDLDSISEILKDKLKVKNFTSKGGKIIVHNNEIAFRIEFELSMDGSVMFDRDGNYIPKDGENNIEKTNDLSEEADIDSSETETVDDEDIEIDEDIKIDEDIETDIETDEEIELDDVIDDIIDETETDVGKNDEDIAHKLIVDDDPEDDDPDTGELSEIDLDIEELEDLDEDDLDFSDDEDIDDILKESREFWENKKS